MASKYRTDLDYNIVTKDMSNEDCQKYLADAEFFVEGRASRSLNWVFRFLQIICKAEKIQPSPEQLIYILCNRKRLLNEACAGAGKTTMSKYRMMLANLVYGIPGDSILALAYNRHAAADIQEKYRRSANNLNVLMNGKEHIDVNIGASTFHAWCKKWVEEYKGRWNMLRISVLSDTDQQNVMNRSIRITMKKLNKNPYLSDGITKAFIQLYGFIEETLTEGKPDEWQVCSAVQDLREFTPTEIEMVLNTYKQNKKLTKTLDYNDFIHYMWELIQDPQVVARLRRVYRFLVVDEYQDITPAMSRILQVFMQGTPDGTIPVYTEGYLTCIGDGDQSIYGFRGTDSDNCIKFRDTYTCPELGEDEVKITAMSINRRCKSEILLKARDIITSNVNRIQKPINYLYEGGSVNVREYTSDNDQLNEIIDLLRTYNTADTCICYRNITSCQYLSMRLLSAGIPFKIAKGIEPFTDIFSASIEGILTLLVDPSIPQYGQKYLYKALPKNSDFKRSTIHDIFQKQIDAMRAATRNHAVGIKNFWEYDFGVGATQRGFTEAIEVLRAASVAVNKNIPMSKYMPKIIQLIRTYYLDGLLKGLMQDRLTDEYIQYITRYYTRNVSYSVFAKEKNKLMENLEANKKNGVYLTTMHGLKGLEFDNVIIMDLDDGLYPGNELKGKYLTQQQKEKIELEARRLLYVAVTRAKDNLTLFFHKQQPTRYIRFFLQNEGLAELYANNSTSNFVDTPTTTDMPLFEDSDDEFIFSEDIIDAVPQATEVNAPVSDGLDLDLSDVPDLPDLDASLGDDLETDMFGDLDDALGGLEDLEEPRSDSMLTESELVDAKQVLADCEVLDEDDITESKPAEEYEDPKSPVYKKPKVASILDILKSNGGI